MAADLLTSDTPTGSSMNNLTPLSELVRLSSKRTRAVFQTESGDTDLGGLDRASVHQSEQIVGSSLIDDEIIETKSKRPLGCRESTMMYRHSLQY